MTATSGRKLSELFTKSDPLGLSARMLLESSRWYSPARRLKWEAVSLCSEKITEKEYCYSKNTSSKPCVVTLSEKAMKSGRLLFRLVPSERPTEGTGYGLSQGGLLPTPMSTDVHHADRVKELKEAGGDTFHSRKNGETRPNGLTDFLDFHGMLPTPAAQDGKNSTLPPSQSDRDTLPGCVVKNCQPTDGQASQLNPLFVTEMMGFPLDWLVSPFQNGGQKPSKP